MARSTQRPQRATQREQGNRDRHEMHVDEDVDVDVDVGENGGEEDPDDADLQRRAYALVRLALFNEQRRLPLRRDEISKKVLGSKGRRFAEVLHLAQHTLRKSFGMELVELQRSHDEDDKNAKKTTDAMGLRKKAAPTGTKTWILRSVLDPRLIAAAVAPHDDLKAIEQAHRDNNIIGEPGEDDDDDDDDAAVKSVNTGAIVAWQRADQLSAIGILYVVLALVLVHGRAISDADLRRLLKRLRIPLTASVPLTSRATAQLTVDAFLGSCTRQGYLERYRVGDAPSTTTNNNKNKNKKRARGKDGGGGEGGEEGETWEWRWGPRAMAEVGEAGVARFVAEFMVGRDLVGEDGDGEEEGEGEEGEGEEGEGGERRRRRLEAMVKGVERASGGALVDSAPVII